MYGHVAFLQLALFIVNAEANAVIIIFRILIRLVAVRMYVDLLHKVMQALL